MTFSAAYEAVEPTRQEIESTSGPMIVEFGAPWCSYCQAAAPLIHEALASFPHVRHVKVEDGRGKPLGRFYRVKLWPTLVFLDSGRELARLVRPTNANVIVEALAQIATADITAEELKTAVTRTPE